MTRRYVARPHTAWEDYFSNKKEWLQISRMFWEFVYINDYEKYVCIPEIDYYTMFVNKDERFGRYYAFLHHRYEVIYEE